MPKIKQFDFIRRKNVTIATISEKLIADGKHWKDLTDICGFSITTANNRKDNPDLFTLAEIRRLKLTDRQIIQLVRGELQ